MAAADEPFGKVRQSTPQDPPRKSAPGLTRPALTYRRDRVGASEVYEGGRLGDSREGVRQSSARLWMPRAPCPVHKSVRVHTALASHTRNLVIHSDLTLIRNLTPKKRDTMDTRLQVCFYDHNRMGIPVKKRDMNAIHPRFLKGEI